MQEPNVWFWLDDLNQEKHKEAIETIKAFLCHNVDGYYFINKLREKLNVDQIAHVIDTLDNTCQECYGSTPCYCWNDE